MILADIGEIGIHSGTSVYKLRPSLYAMSRLGTPKTLVAVLALVYDESVNLIETYFPDELSSTVSFRAAVDVLRACWEGDTTDFDVVIGAYNNGLFEQGLVPKEHVFPLARCLLKHGLIGDNVLGEEQRAQKDEKYEQSFVARDHVAFAMAHLGLCEKDAWNMTMTGVLLAVKAKYPKQETKSDTPDKSSKMTAETYEETMAWLDKINAKRARRTGNGRQ